MKLRVNALVWIGITFFSAACKSAGNKPCTGYLKGPRLRSFGIATLPADQGRLLPLGAGAVIGSVADAETNRGVTSADVSLRVDSASPVLAVVNADSLGGFSFAKVSPGSYLLSAVGRTYPERTIRLEIKPGRLDTARIALRFNPFYLSCETIITS